MGDLPLKLPTMDERGRIICPHPHCKKRASALQLLCIACSERACYDVTIAKCPCDDVKKYIQNIARNSSRKMKQRIGIQLRKVTKKEVQTKVAAEQAQDAGRSRWIACPCPKKTTSRQSFDEKIADLVSRMVDRYSCKEDKAKRLMCAVCKKMKCISQWICISCSRKKGRIVTEGRCSCGKDFHYSCPEPKCDEVWHFEKKPLRKAGRFPQHSCPGCKKRIWMAAARCAKCRKTLAFCECKEAVVQNKNEASPASSRTIPEQNGVPQNRGRASVCKRPAGNPDEAEKMQNERQRVMKKPAVNKNNL